MTYKPGEKLRVIATYDQLVNISAHFFVKTGDIVEFCHMHGPNIVCSGTGGYVHLEPHMVEPVAQQSTGWVKASGGKLYVNLPAESVAETGARYEYRHTTASSVSDKPVKPKPNCDYQGFPRFQRMDSYGLWDLVRHKVTGEARWVYCPHSKPLDELYFDADPTFKPQR